MMSQDINRHNLFQLTGGYGEDDMKRAVGITNTARYRSLEGLERETIDLSLLYCGIEYTDQGHRFGPNKRESYVLHIVLDGKGILEINGDVYHIEKNTAFFISRGVHAYYEADYHDPWHYMWIGTSGVMSKQTAEHAGFTEKTPIRFIDEKKIPKLRGLIEGMIEAYQLTYANELRRLSCLMEFYAILIEDFHEKEGPQNIYDYPIYVYVNQAVDYMKHHYSEKIKVNDIANYIGINRSYLSTSFKQAYGMSPKQYLMDLRMKKATALIGQSNESITAIAKSVGYDDPLTFSKIFRQQMGMAPTQFRKKERRLVEVKKKGDFDHGTL